jgi:uncharacterized membrane-anchored protein YjiN (DUF445 family)
VAVVFLVVTVVGGRATWAGYVQATAEASLVGGLADWFAVTALFRRPLGLPIPHTAIVAEHKEQFGATLGEFIQESFLTPSAIVERVRASDVVTRLADWLADPANAERLAAHAAEAAAAFADILEDDQIGETLAEMVRARIDTTLAAPVAGRMLRYMTREGRHGQLIDAVLDGLNGYLEDHRDDLRGRLGEQSPWWLPGAVEDRLFDRLLDGARTALHDMVGHPEHQLRRDIEASLEKLAADLETSPALRERGEQLKKDLLDEPRLRQLTAELWSQAKDELRAQAGDPGSQLRQRLAAAIAGTGDRLHADPALRHRLSEAVESAVCYVAERFNGEIADLVSGTIARWDTAETSRRLELLLGPDLQYIRINGTVVGGLAGLALYALSRAI